ncbi:MAG: hypothetical protein AAF503_14225 [Pseudomonadota bacterium]
MRGLSLGGRVGSIGPASLIAASLIAACDFSPPPEPIGPPPSSGVGFDTVDTNADATVDRDEWATHGDKTFVSLDTDGSGTVSSDELRAGFDSYDVDGDGVLSPEEVHAPDLDTDGDNVITRSEWEAGIDAGALDANKDGMIARDEYQSHLAQNFSLYDTQVDGRYSRLELDSATPRFTLFRF